MLRFNTSTAIAPRRSGARLAFSNISLAEVEAIRSLLKANASRTCDFTVGGLFMWIDYFHYRYDIIDQTLFVRGRVENNRSITAFSLPVGKMPLQKSVGLILDYCRRNGITPRFSAIPEDCLQPLLKCLPGAKVEELTDWADYLYSAQALATLSGKKLNKKRNHVNRFMADNPGFTFAPITEADLKELRDFYTNLNTDPGATAEAERLATLAVIDNYSTYSMEGAALRLADGTLAAFSIGEVVGDTFYNHIEKINHQINGAGETVAHLMARLMVERHGIAYINREEDCGDPGLRRAKESWHPEALLRKYNVTL